MIFQGEEGKKSRFIVGIDLGTTNNVVAYIDTNLKKNPSLSVQLFNIHQFNSIGVIEPLSMLPSFIYLAEPYELLDDKAKPHWLGGRDEIVGVWAREQGAKIPTRLVQSAKSWLTNAAASGKEKILPLISADESRRMTPVEAASYFLRHIKEAWNFSIGKGHVEDELEEQEIVLTVPASFDEIARTLTLEAARNAGFSKVYLLEEPQAAFYSWIMEHESEIGKYLRIGESILICDVGGGTTDFSLIEVTSTGDKIGFQRTSVGEHLLLGGDNMDHAISHLLEKRLKESGYGELDPSVWLSLQHQARSAKENLLNQGKGGKFSFWVAGKGSSVVEGGVSLEITFEEVEALLVDGFFGFYDFEEAICLKRKNALRNRGLSYESEPSITKHLASFLKKSNVLNKPNYLLFNGGSTKPALFQQRISRSIDHWFPNDEKPIQTLVTKSLDLAVARGAAYFGKVRRGFGVRIGGGSPRSYYMGIDVKNADGSFERKGLTIISRGMEEGSQYLPDHLFTLLSNTPVSFELFRSHTRLGDTPGMLIPIEQEEISLLPPIKTLLRYGKQKEQAIPIKLEVNFTEIGTLELWLQSQISDHRWKLEFQIRGESQEEVSVQSQISDETFDKGYLEEMKQKVQEAFSVGQQVQLNHLIPTLEKLIEKKRNDWPPSLLRALFESTLTQSEKRGLSSEYESRFWHLAGYFLRPGSGYPLDDLRIKEIWKVVLADFKKTSGEDVQIQKWIFYRRIAAGLKKGQQLHLFNDLFPTLYDKKGKIKGKYAYSEKLRALASLELVDTSLKVKLGKLILDRILNREGEAFEFWALSRIGARCLSYGSIGNVIPRLICEDWVEKLLDVEDQANMPFLLFMLAQKSGVREIDLSEHLFLKVEARLDCAQEELKELLNKERVLTFKERERVFGDSLPAGLILG